MSAAQWRRAMNSNAGHGRGGWRGFSARDRLATPAVAKRDPAVDAGGGDHAVLSELDRRARAQRARTEQGTAAPWLRWILDRVGARHWIVLAAVLLYPWVATPFFTYQIGAQSLALGLIALSLTFLGGYGGMVSLAQMSIAGLAGYLVAIFGASSLATISLGWPWWLAVIFAVLISAIVATLVGWLSVRTEGIYTIMITLAVGVAFFYLVQQNYSLFNGFQGFNKVFAPTVFGIDFRQPIPYYYLALFWALAGYWFIKYLIGAPFGLALQGVRDNPRRMNSLGFNVIAHRVAAYAVAGVLAAIGGVLLVWYHSRISSGSVRVAEMINILVIAVMGGMKHPIGAFIGAIVFVLLQNFAIDLVDRERFNLVIGGVFLLIVLFSPDGLLGLWQWLRGRLRGRSEFRSGMPLDGAGASTTRPVGRLPGQPGSFSTKGTAR